MIKSDPRIEHQGDSVFAPMNMKLARPNVPVADWDDAMWLQLNTDVGGNPGFFPLTVKAAYVIGIIHGLAESVSCLLYNLPGSVSLLPAFGVFGASIDLLGRCLNGSDAAMTSSRDLKTGFNWLREQKLDDSDSSVVVHTSQRAYTVADLVQLRHFAAHGQANARQRPAFDEGLLEPMPSLLATGLEVYWNELQQSETACNDLARANILALRSSPVLQSWSMFEQKSDGRHESMTQIFSGFDWRVRH